MATLDNFDLNGILSNMMRFEPSPEEKRKAQTMALLKSGLGILAQGGPSAMPRSFGQILGQAGTQGLDAYEGQIKSQRDERRVNAQNAISAAQISRQFKMQPLEEEKLMLSTAAEKAKAEAERVQAEYFQKPEVQSALQKGDINTVFAGLPRKSPSDIVRFAEVLRKQSDFKPIGSGGAIGPNGEMIAPMARPTMEKKEMPGAMRQRISGDQLIEEEYQADGTWKELGRGPRFARQVGTTVTQEAVVTPVTIADPKDPNKTIIIDGRTGRVFGAGPKATETGRMENKRSFGMQGLGASINEARGLLTGASGHLPTGSGIGSLYDSAAGIFGASPSGAKEAEQLKAIGGALVSKMPRMEGPQSDKDTLLYKEMAARVGDSTVPRDRRLAALDIVEQLWSKYETSAQKQQPQLPSIDAIEAELARRKKR